MNLYGKNVRVSLRMTDKEAECYKQGWTEPSYRRFSWTVLIHRALSFYADRLATKQLPSYQAAADQAAVEHLDAPVVIGKPQKGQRKPINAAPKNRGKKGGAK